MNKEEITIGAKVKTNELWSEHDHRGWQLAPNSIIISECRHFFSGDQVLISNSLQNKKYYKPSNSEIEKYKKLFKEILSDSLLEHAIEWPIQYLDVVAFKCKRCCVIDDLLVHRTEAYYLCKKCMNIEYNATMYNKFGFVRKI